MDEVRMKKVERLRDLRWNAQPAASRRSTRTGLRLAASAGTLTPP
jgi:hypothetical protein